MRFKQFIARIYDIPNAFRVLDIMDKCGCDIERADNYGIITHKSWRIKPKWYVTEQEAKDLQEIILFKQQYRRRSKLWNKLFFRHFRYGCRPPWCWAHYDEAE